MYYVKAKGDLFLSTLSLRRATIAFSFQGVQFLLFLSTLSLRRATGYNVITHGNVGDFYPRSPCGERLCWQQEQGRVAHISIHALLAESDAFYNRFKPCARYFYPRSPCGERRSDIFPVLRFSLFLSTLSLRRATVSLQRWAAHLCDFYPRSPCGERLKLPPPPPLLLPISIHALLAESDVRQGMATLSQPIFLSTLSLRRATCGAVWGRCAPQISIHALLAESDCFCLCHLPAPGNFYPRSPCGERPCWRWDNPNTKPNFYPRSPCGERPASIFA